MKVIEYLKKHPESNGSDFRVKIPEKYLPAAQLAGLNTDIVYLFSHWTGGVWVKSDLKSNRMYPLTGYFDLGEWEIYED